MKKKIEKKNKNKKKQKKKSERSHKIDILDEYDKEE